MQSKRALMRLSTFSFLLLVFVSTTFAQQKYNFTVTAPLPLDPAVRTGKLPNGLTYYIRKNAKPEKRVEMRLAVNAGSLLENDDQQGLAHFLEHMAFNGTKNFKKNELVDFLEGAGVKFGAHLNAYTSFDETVYMLQLPTDKPDVLDKGYQVLEDWAHQLAFDPTEIDKERGVVIEEWRLGKGADARMRDKYLPVLFHKSRYAERLPIGKKEVLEGFKHQTLIQFYKDWYRPDLMSVIVVGDIDVNATEKKIKEVFGRIATVPNAKPRINYDMPTHKEPLVAVASDKEATRTIVQLYFKHKSKESGKVQEVRDFFVHSLYNNMINARLAELTQKPDAPFLYGMAYYGQMLRHTDIYSAIALVQPDSIKTGLAALVKENEKVRRFGFTQTELDRQKEELRTSIEQMYKERDKTESANYAQEYVNHYLKGEGTPGIEFTYAAGQKFLPEITLAEINQLATQWITDENMVAIVTMPEKEDIKIPTEAEILATLTEARQAQVTAYTDNVTNQPLMAQKPTAGKVTQESVDKKHGITTWTLSNGAKVVFKPTDFKNDEVLFGAWSPGGNSQVQDSDYVSAMFCDDVITEGGISEFEKTTLTKMLAGKVVSVSPYVGELSEGFFGEFAPKDAETAMQLINLYITKPRKDPDAFKSFYNRYESTLKNRSASPEAHFGDTLSVTLAQGHFRRRPLSVSLLKELQLEKAMTVFQDRFKDASDFTFYFVGNIKPAELKPLVETYLASLPSLNRKEAGKDIGVRPPTGIVKKVVKKGIEPKSRVNLTFTGDYKWSLDENFRLDALTKVLNIKLRENLREDKGGVYGVGVYAVPSLKPRQEYKLIITFGCAPDKVEELIQAVFSEVEKLQKSGAEDKDLKKVKETYKREHETNLKENRYWLELIKENISMDAPVAENIRTQERADKLSADDIKRAANTYTNKANYVQVVLMPEK